MSLLNKARKIALSLGVDVQRASIASSWRKRLPFFLDVHKVRNVLDVGADHGDFAIDLLKTGFTGKVYSFEPLPNAHQRLCQRATSLGYDRWIIGPQIALSNRDGEVEFFESGNSVSSSLLKMNQRHIEAAPHSAPVKSFAVSAKRLDDVLVDLNVSGPSFLKLDVQGAENLVLDGAEVALEKTICGIQIELSVETLYDGQTLDQDLMKYIKDKGYVLWDILPGFRNNKNFRLLQYDAVYFKESDVGIVR